MKNQHIPRDFKQKCNDLVNLAVKLGLIIKPGNCEKCGKESERIEGHHDDYFKVFEVNWLCKPCHAKRHVELGTYELAGRKASATVRARKIQAEPYDHLIKRLMDL